jgi:hypothetical protein
MPLDRNAGGHRFDDGEKCAKCEMTREQWDDTQKRCTGRPDAEPEAAFARRIARSISTPARAIGRVEYHALETR